MKLLIVRHGEPDYEHDTLTGKGWHEAALLADWLSRTPADFYYVSPLGRARDTASLTLQRLGREAETLDWLQEFPARIHRPDKETETICWDWLPQDWLADTRFLSKDRWLEPEAMAGVREIYDRVIAGFDGLLAARGYVRDGLLYRAEQSNSQTLVLFCHFGLKCVLLSHLMNVSPMVLWHGLCAAPTSVTTVITEERRPGIAAFRTLCFGGVTHLLSAGEQPSFAARFCEQYGTPGQRAD